MELRLYLNTDHKRRQFWVVAAEREDAGRFIVRADEKLTAFLELEGGDSGARASNPASTKNRALAAQFPSHGTVTPSKAQLSRGSVEPVSGTPVTETSSR